MKTIRFGVILMALLLSAIVPAKELPSECRSDCVAPYGKVLGKSPSGVISYSNCNASCVVFEPARHEGTYTGIKWQCVEYARRWLLINMGAVYGDVDVAADIWTRIDHLQPVDKNTDKISLQKLANGSKTPPRRGDLLVYGREYLGTGHVAVITTVDIDAGQVRVAEQNYENAPWSGPWAREIPLIRHGEAYWLLDPYLLGWVRSQTAVVH